MKKIIKSTIIAVILLTTAMMSMAQTPPHPNAGNAPGSGNTPVGGGAPIDGGLSILLLMGAAYGSRKLYQMKK